jgi:murein DD-endopeptidase MepM/ murein hydrolase activator NlpD
MLNKKFIIFSLILLVSCVQDKVDVVYKEDEEVNKIGKQNTLQPSYMKGTYVKTKNNKIVRDLKGQDDNKNNNEEETLLTETDIKNNEVEAKKDIEVKKARKVLKTITVKSGDSLLGITAKYGMTLAEIAKLNNIKSPYKIYIGQNIKVYVSEYVSDDKSTVKKSVGGVVIVKSGDSLLKIAANNNSTLRELAEINNIKPPYKVYIGQKIKIPSNENNKINKSYYTVKNGDNLYSIAKNNNISFTDLVKDNNLKKPYNIYVGQRLHISGKNSVNINNNTNINVEKEEELPSPEVKEKKANKVTVAPITNNNTSNDGNETFVWPVKGEVIKKFGKQANGEASDAINIRAGQGTGISVTSSGEIVYAGNELKGYGNMIIVKHKNGWLSIYGHCDTIEVKVKDKVEKGQIIARVGKTGNVSEPQLYFGIRKGRVPVDPLKYLTTNN